MIYRGVVYIFVSMKIKIDLPDSYWYALSVMSEKSGYPTRQTYVSEALVRLVETDPDALQKGKEKEVLMRQARDVVKDVPRVIASIPIPMKRNWYVTSKQRWAMEFWDSDRDSRTVEAMNHNEAFRVVFGRYPLDDKEYNEMVKECRLV